MTLYVTRKSVYGIEMTCIWSAMYLTYIYFEKKTKKTKSGGRYYPDLPLYYVQDGIESTWLLISMINAINRLHATSTLYLLDVVNLYQ